MMAYRLLFSLFTWSTLNSCYEHDADIFFLKNYQKSGDFLNLMPLEKNIIAALKKQDILQYIITRCEGSKEKHSCQLDNPNFRHTLYPGTFWCAENDQISEDAVGGLGYFRELDSCCKTHHNCSKKIQPFASAYGIDNRENYTVYDCQCDDDFITCLSQIRREDSWIKIMKNLEYRSSQLYGVTYFNTLKTDCVEFPDDNDTFFPKFNFMGGLKPDEKPILKLPRYFKPSEVDNKT